MLMLVNYSSVTGAYLCADLTPFTPKGVHSCPAYYTSYNGTFSAPLVSFGQHIFIQMFQKATEQMVKSLKLA